MGNEGINPEIESRDAAFARTLRTTEARRPYPLSAKGAMLYQPRQTAWEFGFVVHKRAESPIHLLAVVGVCVYPKWSSQESALNISGV